MAAIDATIHNFLSPLNFKFKLKRAPNLNFFVQQITIPGVSLPSVDVSNPLLRIPYAGDHVIYEELSLTFKVDENLQNYLEIQNWIRGVGKTSYQKYAAINSNKSYTGDGITSEISVSVLTSSKNPNYEIVFQEAFPISLSGLTFKTTDDSVDYLEATAQFRYLIYDINKIT